ncbi:insulinase family protein [Candidatus Collinsella stercoripullorum]|uniref:insulinase family protein n=1 Tax=Candidatus Collinsella stercoripullorum TaxID=2838522 RepID=UPI0022E59247|nr:insulinase family protein [Candidatus Collinsella stercoripullorum]
MSEVTTSSDSEPTARERAAARLARGTELHGFTVERIEEIGELDADAYVMRHASSGARLVHLACEDENKALAIAFKTPPVDDTGVFHILEHSVLNGSAKFPVKEPFVDLIKGSMQTFLNAMTYPDKTVYPVASTNEQDLLNLMDVYMDAVLNPAIYTKRAIFEQEGWHFELDEGAAAAGQAVAAQADEGVADADGAFAAGQAPDGTEADGAATADGADAPASPGLRYNGVVFNEMKGALSDPLDVLDNAIGRALFPDTAYACESGGNPRAIPELTYEGFLDTHARHYNLANSYIVLYGDLDPDRVLGFLDDRYLSAAARDAADEAKRAAGTLVAHPGEPNPLLPQQPTVCDLARVEMPTTPENAQVGMAYVIGQALDRKRVIAADVLFEALLGSNEAPVKKAILAAGLGGNVLSYTEASCLQPYELIILQSAKPDAARAFREVIEGECRRLADEGIPRDRLEAVLSSNEYDLRQRDYGMADGVAIACDMLSTWLYDDGAATLALKYGPVYAELRRELEGDYFENLLRELVLESEHRALVELVPREAREDDDPSIVRLPPSERPDPEAVAADVAALRAVQEAEDTPEARATLPRLHVSDIGPARPEPALTLDTRTPLPCLKHGIPTHRLAYLLAYFDLSHIAYTELPYVSVLARLMKQLGTARRSASELDSYVGSNLGFLAFAPEVMAQPNWKLAKPVLAVAAGALSEKLDALATIPAEVWGETVFTDTDRIRDVLTQMRIGMEQGFITAGHQAALNRSWSYVSPAGMVAEKLSGVDFYRFLRDLLDHFDERAEELCGKLRELQGRIFTSTDTVMSFTGSDEDYDRFWAAAGTMGLAPRTAAAKELYVPMPEPRHEAFIIPSDICYVARTTDPRVLGLETDGTWGVAASALSYDYLWNEIRVKGGAYGCGFRVVPDRQLLFYTYRDPAIDPSIERIAGAGAWLSGFDPDPQAFEGFIVSSVAGHDAPLKPYALTRRQNLEFFTGRPVGWRARMREDILAATPEKVRALGDDVARAAEEAPLCVFGGREVIERSEAGLVPVDLLG